MKRAIAAIIVVGAILAIALSCGAPARAQKAEQNDRSLMRKKLEYSQRILEGIATQDFDLIRQNAEAMQEPARSKAFSSVTSTKYRAQFLMFDFANSELVRMAKDKNLDGAALAHTQLVLSCVKCHQQLRALAR